MTNRISASWNESWLSYFTKQSHDLRQMFGHGIHKAHNNAHVFSADKEPQAARQCKKFPNEICNKTVRWFFSKSGKGCKTRGFKEYSNLSPPHKTTKVSFKWHKHYIGMSIFRHKRNLRLMSCIASSGSKFCKGDVDK